MEVAIVSKKSSFDAAHRLPNYDGKCSNLHGHHWVVEVAAEGNVSRSTGMITDFSRLKEFLELMCSKFDHKLVNDVIANPTAENIAGYIYGEFSLWCVARGLRTAWVKLYETEDSSVTILRGANE